MKRKPKAASTDYTQAMLPQTRKAVFFDVLHLHWQKLLLLGFVLLCFAVPLLLSTVVRDIYVPNFLNAIAPDAQAEAGYALAYWEIARSIIGILFLMLFSVGLSGVLRILRQYAWLENVHIGTSIYVQVVIWDIVCYGLLSFLQYKKIQKIPMEEALKNRE